MKRLIGSLMVCAALLTLAACQSELPSLQLYVPVVEAAMAGKWAYGAGALYDLDGDGVEELIMQHSKAETMDMDGEAHEAPVCGVSVYTLDKNGVVPVLEHQDLYIEAGGNGGYLTVAEKDKELYLSVLTSGEDGRGCESVRETRTVYRIADCTAEVTEEGVYCYDIGETGETIFVEATLNGAGCSRMEYEAWAERYTALFVLNPYTYNDPVLGNPHVHSLEDLAAYLKEME